MKTTGLTIIFTLLCAGQLAEAQSRPAQNAAAPRAKAAARQARANGVCPVNPGQPLGVLRARKAAAGAVPKNRTLVSVKPIKVGADVEGTVTTYDDASMRIDLNGQEVINLDPEDFRHDMAVGTPYIFRINGEDLQLSFGQTLGQRDTVTKRTFNAANVFTATVPLKQIYFGESGSLELATRQEVTEDVRMARAKARTPLKDTELLSTTSSAVLNASIDINDNITFCAGGDVGVKTCSNGKTKPLTGAYTRIGISIDKVPGCEIYCECSLEKGENVNKKVTVGVHGSF